MKPLPHNLFCCLAILAIGLTSQPILAQNLVQNGSFESITECPTFEYGAICEGYAPPWQCANESSADLFNACGNPYGLGVPDNHRGFQEALTGSGYAGIICRWDNQHYAEYIMIELTQPLDTGVWYNISFYLNLANDFCGIRHFGAYFSENNPFVNNWDYLPVFPQVETNMGYLSETIDWMPVAGCYLAQGGERFLTLGNFRNYENTELDSDCEGNSNSTYYYIEDVFLAEGNAPEELSIDLDSPVEACFSYEIDPMHPGPVFYWNTGDRTPTLTVTESGIYTVTVSDGCNTGTAEIEVTIHDSIPAVELGAETVVLCEGASIDIELDPALDEYTWQDGSNGASYTISEAGTYAVTLDDGCSFSTDQVVVSILSPPMPFSLGEDVDFCSGDEIQYDFDPSLGDFEWQDGSTSPSYTIQAPDLYALTISNDCGQQSDDILLTDLEIPEVFIGPENQILCSGGVIDIAIDPALGDILWSDGWNQSEYQISAAGIYTVYVTNQCGTGSAQITVSAGETPQVDFGIDTVLCANDTLVLITSVANGIYTWQDNSTNDSMVVTTPGIYQLQVQNECGMASDQITVSYQPPLQPIDFGPDQQICNGEQFILHSLNPGAQHVWQDGSVADSLVVSTSGLYHVLVSNSCETVSDTISVILSNQPPAVDLGDQLTLCQGQSIALDANVTGVNFHWNDNSIAQQLIVNAPGQYSVTVSNTCGADQDTIIVLDGGPAPSVDLGAPIDLCPGESVTLSPVYANVDNWLWSDGSMLAQYVVGNSGQITVAVSNACGIVYDTIVANLLPDAPLFNLGPDTSICDDEILTLSIPLANVNILWPDGSDLPDYLVQGPASVIAQVSNSCGMSFDTISIGLLPDIAPLDLGPDQSLCPGELILIDPGFNMVTYHWQDGSTNATYSTSHAEQIILVISNACDNATDTLEIFESTTGPQVDLGDDIHICEGASVTIQSGVLGVDYLWQDGSTGPEFIADQSTMVILEVSNNCGIATDTVIVDVSGTIPMPDLGPDTMVCEGVVLVLTSNADATTSIQWQDGSTGINFNVTQPGIFILAESNHCGSAEDTLDVNFISAPEPFTLGPDTIVCPGETVVLSAPLTTDHLQWQDGSHSQTFIADYSGIYTLEISNTCGVQKDELELSVDTHMPVVNQIEHHSICLGQELLFNVQQSFPVEYAWNDGSALPELLVTLPGTYIVEISTDCSTASGTFDVVQDTDCDVDVSGEIYIPNIFSPDGDGINDLFSMATGSDVIVTAIDAEIFDRWGNMVFSSTEIPFEWNGYFNGEILQAGVFVYTIHVNWIINGKEMQKVFTGDVTLLR